jgi:hypothetical protein
VLLAVRHDSLSRYRPHARQPVELGDARYVQLDPSRRRARQWDTRGQRRVDPLRHHNLLAVGEPGSEIQAVDVSLARRASRRFERIVDTRTCRQTIDARRDHLAAEVDDQQRCNLRRRCWSRRGMLRHLLEHDPWRFRSTNQQQYDANANHRHDRGRQHGPVAS